MKIRYLSPGLLAVLYCLITTPLFAQKVKNQSSPNVLIIYTDDQGTLDVNCYGAKDLQTPNIDRLAKEGVRFTQFYAAAPVCSPSRASLLTGRYPQRAQLDNNAPSQEGLAGMPGSQYTMAEMFKDGGYTTAHIGKWHIGYSPETMPNQQGFDYSFGFMGGCIDNYSHFFYWAGPNRHDLWRNGQEIWEDGRFFADLTVEEVNGFLKKNKQADKPFFLYWAINMPHYPLQGQEKWRNYYKDLPAPRRMYAAAISTMDEKIGEVLQQLDKLGLAENTIVVFQSDQGHSIEERTFGGGGFAGAYRGAKFSLFEGGIRVPAIIRWTNHLPKNEVRDQLCTNIDWYPTLAGLCHVPLPQRKIDGKDIQPVISSAKTASPHDLFFWQSQGTKESPQWAVRKGNWKLLHNPATGTKAEMGPDELFLVDIQKDSSETNNLAAQHPEIVSSLKEQYLKWINEVKEQ